MKLQTYPKRKLSQDNIGLYHSLRCQLAIESLVAPELLRSYITFLVLNRLDFWKKP